ncbi:MAG: DUF3488 domain-containing transglutaminase family protein [Desulfobacterales bacterium]|nr:DUF3488 domain-containing transglutaminase family protein [Desulfobacterales bacterium]
MISNRFFTANLEIDTKSQLIPILFAIVIAIAPHIVRLPAWILICCFVSWGYVALSLKYRLPWPPKWLCQILGIIGFCGVLATFGRILGREASVALLSILLAFKTFETITYRDRMIIIFLAYFLVITNLFYFETLSMTLYMFVSVFITTSVLIHINYPKAKISANLVLAGNIMLKSLPLMVFLFLLFPRIQGSLWGTGRHAAKTGFSDHLTIGDISSLSKNNEIAFRVEFKGKIPKGSSIYWRGVVLWNFDGESWKRGLSVPLKENFIVGGEDTNYTVTLEPHDQRFLFALDMPISIPSNINADFFSDETIMARFPIRKRLKYSIKSITVYNTGDMKKWEERAIHIPRYTNPKSIELGKKWGYENKDKEELIYKALNYFKKNEFAYTLSPPRLDKINVIDDFLFRTKKGYCEHFAASFALLMRASGIPSRVVIGYQGAEFNPIGNYYIIRQSDAHAWVEVWLDKKGWVRIDPTSVVAPERLVDNLDSLNIAKRGNRFSSFSRYVEFGWDTINSRWNQWIMDYTSLEQSRIFSFLGIKINSIKGILRSIFVFISLTFCVLLPVTIGYLYKQQVKIDIVKLYYDKFCEKLYKAGIERLPNQGPLDYYNKIILLKPGLKPKAEEIINLYIALNYGFNRDEKLKYKFRDMVKRFDT